MLVDQVLLNEVAATPETHPATRDSMMKLLMAVDKRDKFRFFTTPVTEQMVSSGRGSLLHTAWLWASGLFSWQSWSRCTLAAEPGCFLLTQRSGVPHASAADALSRKCAVCCSCNVDACCQCIHASHVACFVMQLPQAPIYPTIIKQPWTCPP